MDFKGTIGKWEYRYDRFEYCYDIVSDNEFICTTVSGNTKAKANALLISKAPEMLEMLEDVVKFLAKVQAPATASLMLSNEINKLIKEATEL